MYYAILVVLFIIVVLAGVRLTFASAQEGVYGTFAVRIPAGSFQEGTDTHYDPANIAVPAGTTVIWFNDDPGEPHTVTSGSADDGKAGSIFDSNLIVDGAFFQYTFENAGDFPYYCELHPSMTGSVSVSGAFEIGNYFTLRHGAPPIFNFTEHERTLLHFTPKTIQVSNDEPVTYQLTILKNGEEAFSDEFQSRGGDLQVELIPTDGETRVYGPDISDPIIGAYHIEGSFLKDNAAYTIRAEITRLFDRAPEERLVDEFGVRIVPEFRVSILALMVAGIGAAIFLTRQSTQSQPALKSDI